MINGEITTSISLVLRTSRPVRDEMVTSDYLLNIDRLRGRFSVTVITAEDLMITKLEGWPDIKSRYSFRIYCIHIGNCWLRLTAVSQQYVGNMSREDMNLAEVVEEVAVQAVRGVQLDIRYNNAVTIVNALLLFYRPSLISNFPKFERTSSNEGKDKGRKV